MAAKESAQQAASMADIGERLKEAREKKSLTIEQAQRQTHIHSAVLIAIEEGRCDGMLAPAYVKSFLKKYSSLLGLDSKEILSAYSALHPELERQAVNVPGPEPKGPQDISIYLNAARYVLVVIIILFLVIFLGKKVTESVKIYKISKAAASKSGIPQKKPSVKSQNPASPKAKEEEKGPFNLVIKIKQNVYLKVKKDGEVLFGSVLKKGATESLKAKQNIELYVSKAEAIELVLDGKPLASPGKGVIKNLEITKKGTRIR